MVRKVIKILIVIITIIIEKACEKLWIEMEIGHILGIQFSMTQLEPCWARQVW